MEDEIRNFRNLIKQHRTLNKKKKAIIEDNEALIWYVTTSIRSELEKQLEPGLSILLGYYYFKRSIIQFLRRFKQVETKIEKLKELKKNYEKTREQKAALLKEGEVEICFTRELIQSELSKQLEPFEREILSIKEKIIKQYRRIVLFSTFDNEIIGKILEQLVTTIEGEEYCYMEGINKTSKKVYTSESIFFVPIEKYVRIIIKKSLLQNNKIYREFGSTFKFNRINELAYYGSIILLSTSEYVLNSEIRFNELNEKNSNRLIISNVEYGEFDYVSEFMDMVINYRVANEILDISEIELYKLLGEFLNNKKANINIDNQKDYSSQLDATSGFDINKTK